jgi:hypothetical protein
MSVPSQRAGASVGVLAALAAGLLLGGCAVNGDFDRVKPGLVADSIHDWVGATAAMGNGAPVSEYPLTDDERLLRDLAYPLIESPFDRAQWYSVLNEYGVGRIFHPNWWRFDQEAYVHRLLATTYRSEAARYAQLGDDIGNDRARIPPFFLLARRVLEMDRVRQTNMAAVSTVSDWERANAMARVAENKLVVSWVQWSLMARAHCYRVALERLAIGVPMTAATEIDRSLIALQDLMGRYRVLPLPDLAPGAPIPPFPGPPPLTVLGQVQKPKPPVETVKLSPALSSKGAL